MEDQTEKGDCDTASLVSSTRHWARLGCDCGDRKRLPMAESGAPGFHRMEAGDKSGNPSLSLLENHLASHR